MKTLETKRLILRNFKESDLNDFFEYASVEGVGEKAGWPHHTDVEVTKKILHEFIEKDEVYAVVLKDTNKVIGSLGLHHNSFDPEAYPDAVQRELGYVLAKPYWGKGLMPEAVKAAITYAFEELKLDVLWCGHFEENHQSCRVIAKSGFRFYKDGVYEAKQLGKSFVDKKYIMTKADYEVMTQGE